MVTYPPLNQILEKLGGQLTRIRLQRSKDRPSKTDICTNDDMIKCVLQGMGRRKAFLYWSEQLRPV
eukprot:6179982-Pleurochrysis_carterae.AAC.7